MENKNKVFGFSFYAGLIVLLIDFALMLLFKIRMDFGFGIASGLIAASVFHAMDAIAESKKKETEEIK